MHFRLHTLFRRVKRNSGHSSDWFAKFIVHMLRWEDLQLNYRKAFQQSSLIQFDIHSYGSLRIFQSFLLDFATNANHQNANRRKRKLSALFVVEKFPFLKPFGILLKQKILEIPYAKPWKCLFKYSSCILSPNKLRLLLSLSRRENGKMYKLIQLLKNSLIFVAQPLSAWSDSAWSKPDRSKNSVYSVLSYRS